MFLACLMGVLVFFFINYLVAVLVLLLVGKYVGLERWWYWEEVGC